MTLSSLKVAIYLNLDIAQLFVKGKLNKAEIIKKNHVQAKLLIKFQY